MCCDICGEKMIRIVGSYPFKSRMLGEVSVPSLEYWQCQNCNDVLFSSDMANKAHEYINQAEKEALSSIAIKEFVSLNESAKILGLTKQGFSKNSRIKRGFIYSIKVGNKKFFYRKSVESFKKTGDGRIKLEAHKRVDKKDPVIIFVTVPKPQEASQYDRMFADKKLISNYVNPCSWR